MGTTHQSEPTYLPRGIVDPNGTTGYIADASGGISAINLLTGGVLWSTSKAARPLLLRDHRLAALRAFQPNALQVVVLDVTQQGAVVLVSEPVVFPEWVRVSLHNTATFALHARMQNSDLLLDWEAHTLYRGGAAPPTHVLQQATKHVTGTVQVDLVTGRVTMLPRDESEPLSVGMNEQPVSPVPEPGAREITVIAPRLYYLVDEPASAGVHRTCLKAREMGSNQLLWELPLEERRVSRPTPLRQ